MTGDLHMPEPVECYSGAEYAEAPRRFLWEGEWRTISRIIARRRLPEGKQFVVDDGQGGQFVLTYESERERWTIMPGR
ncbi:MAG: hypothetical protein WBM17_01610 [Anaerolineales bacterium]